MWMIIISAIINLLIYFFEHYWTGHPPVAPDTARVAFIEHVGRLRYFYLGARRKEYAGKMFDKFCARYREQPPGYSPSPLSADSARSLATGYAQGLTLTEAEME